MRIASAVAAIVVAALAWPGPAQAERRVALVIGNGTYADVPRLANPVNDAAAIAAAFRRLDFDDVVLKSDLDYAGFRRTMVEFAKLADGADVAVLYYAGHGIEIDGRNFLIPVDARLQSARDADFEAMSLDLAMSALDGARDLRVVILDACRDNPFGARMTSAGGTRSIGRGLARVETPGNTLVAYAAKDGTTAADGDGTHSPFTAALLEEIETPGVEVRLMFGRVRDAVLRRTNNRQEPFVYGAVGGREIYLGQKAAAATAASPSPVPPAVVGVDREVVFWNSVKDSRSPAVLQTYLDRYPDGLFSGLASVMIEQMKGSQDAGQAVDTGREGGDRVAVLTPPAGEETPTPRSVEEMVALAARYATGDGVARDLVAAAKWYREAAGKGDAEAKYRLGLFYYRGEGVGRSYTEAAVQILDAVRAGHVPARDTLSAGQDLDEPEFLKLVQQRLKALGYYQSTIDGIWGPGSRNAVLAFARGDPVGVAEKPRARAPRVAPRRATARSEPPPPPSGSTPRKGRFKCRNYPVDPECFGVGQ